MEKREDQVVRKAMEEVASHRRRHHGQDLLPFLVVGWVAVLAAFFLAPWPLETKLWAAAHGLCSQRPGHLLAFGTSDGPFLPLCARDSGIYLGIVLGLGYLLARGKWRAAGRPARWFWAAASAILAFTAVDVANSVLEDWFHLQALYPRHNLVSMASGLLLGALIAVLLLWVVHLAFANRRRERPIVGHWGDLLGLLAVEALGGVLLASGRAVLYLPLAVLSLAGLLAALVAANALWLLTATRGRELLTSAWEAVPPLTWGSALALAEMAVLSYLRYRLGF